MNESRLTRLEWRWLAGILLAAAAARLAVIPLHVYAPDQSFSVDLARMGWLQMIKTTAQDTHPPLYYGLLKAWFWLGPDTMQWAQVLSVFIAIPALLVIFFLTRGLFSPAAAWAALGFASFMPYQIYWSHVARNHQLMALAVPLSVWTGYRWLARPARARWWAMAASLALMVNTNYIALVILPVWVLGFLIEPIPWRRRLQLILAPIPGLLVYVPWIPVMLAQMHTRGNPISRAFFQETVWPFYLFFHSIFGRMTCYQPPVPWALFMAMELVFVLIAVAGARAVGRRWSFWVLMIGLPAMPVAVAYFADFSLAERHINFGVPLFMAYWGASVVEAFHWARNKFK
ncbi:MAG: glycosyltransferase family 39 protein [Candidatus Sumerlaeia bacterium]